MILGFIALALAFLLTAAIPAILAGDQRLAGVDRAGSAIQYFFVCAPRWMLIGAVLIALLSIGRFDWLPAGRVGQVLIVVGAHVAISLVSIAAIVTADMMRDHRAAWVVAMGPTVGVPLMVIAWCALALVDRPAGWANSALAGVALVTIAGGAIWLLVHSTRGASRTAADQQARSVDSARETAAREINCMAAMDALPPDGPLGPWLPYTNPAEPPAVVERATAAILARPTFAAELSAALENEWRQEALSFVANHLPAPGDPALVPAVSRAILRDADQVRRRLDEGRDLYDDAFTYECLRAVGAASKFDDDTGALVDALEALHDALADERAQGTARRGRAELLAHLKAQRKGTRS